MKRFNLHGHSKYCDGKGELKTYVEYALAHDYEVLGFSSHAPMPVKSDWHIPLEQLESYYREIDRLKALYEDQLIILKSLEIDFVEDLIGPSNFKKELDYTVGSVHYIYDNEDNLFQLDESKLSFHKFVTNSGFSIKEIVKAYYLSLQNMIQNDCPDIIGHLDSIKKFNGNCIYFNEQENWYQELVFETLELISGTEGILEINTRGNYKKLMSDFYPSDWIIRRAIELKIPITLNSDAHVDFELEKGKSEALQLLSLLGLKELTLIARKGIRELTKIP